ncbi:actin polymerization-dependent cell motility [Sparganum proliferum]
MATSRVSSHSQPGRMADSNPSNKTRILAQFEADHLSTLVTNRQRAPPDPESSLKRLRHLRDNNQLAATSVLLVIQDNAGTYELIVKDRKTGDICEVFPLDEITSPIYKESNDPTDRFSNLLMFNVNAGWKPGIGPEQHEMHIFQILKVAAHVVVEALKADYSQTPQPSNHHHHHHHHHEKQAESVQDFEELESRISKRSVKQESAPIIQPSRQEYQRSTVVAPTSDTTSDEGTQELESRARIGSDSNDLDIVQMDMSNKKALIDAEILLLNMCFDDIESYVGHIVRLNRARSTSSLNKPTVDDNVSVAASDEKKKKKKRLVFRKRSTTKPKERDLPKVLSNTSISSEVEVAISDEELVDLFEKIKFSIVLLARLQGFVSEPNPPLLTHRLFTILHQPVDFVRDLHTGKPELARRVVAPLFPAEAIRLIRDSLIEPEVSMWHELGDAWCIPREQWHEDVPIYIPLFKCGFRPNPDQYHFSLFKKVDNTTVNDSESVRSKTASVSSVPAEFASNAEYYQFLVQRRAHFAKVKRDFVAENTQELSLKAGEYVEVLDSSRNWNRLRNRKGMEGYSPYTVLDFNVP